MDAFGVSLAILTIAILTGLSGILRRCSMNRDAPDLRRNRQRPGAKV
jgi:hypothetical protein